MTHGTSGWNGVLIRRFWIASLGLLALMVGAWGGGAKAWAQSKKPAAAGPETEQGAPGTGPAIPQGAEVLAGEPPRYMLVAAGDEILRVDKVTGQVSFCRKANSAWRCLPAPDAERAYIEEIEALTGEVEQLKADLATLQAKLAENESGLKPDGQAGVQTPGLQPGAPKGDPGISSKDEAELERMLDITENAMRRFFGLMNELKQDFEGDKKG